jgi:hypothetical protein
MVEKRVFPAFASGFLIIILLETTAFPSDRARVEFHTTPDRWKEWRMFHRPFDPNYESRLELSHSDMDSATGERSLSPNRAYWFALVKGDHMKPGPRDANLFIFNERDSLVHILVKDYLYVEANWINEKLVYVEIWWGRVLGTYMIFDVEREEIVTREMIHEGGTEFMQWQQARQVHDRPETEDTAAEHEQSLSGEREK